MSAEPDDRLFSKASLHGRWLKSAAAGRPEITVAVTAYDRKEFVLAALRSAVDQTLPREKYEVVLVKNFSDEEIDEYASSHDIRLVSCAEPAIGEMAWAAISSSSGEVVSFLDDDDLFARSKLEAVSRAMGDRSVGYYHNNVEVLDGCGRRRPLLLRQPTRSEALELPTCDRACLLRRIDDGAAFNSSSISVRRDLLLGWEATIRRSVSGPGFVLFLISLLSSRAIIDTTSLTVYRSHPSKAPGKLVARAALSVERSLATLRSVSASVSDRTCRAVVDYKINEFLIRSYLYGNASGGGVARWAAARLAKSPLSYMSPYRLLPIYLAFLWPFLPARFRRTVLISSAL